MVVTFNLPLPGQIDPNSSDVQQMMLQYNVTIHIKPVRREEGGGRRGEGGGGRGGREGDKEEGEHL